MPYRLSLLLRLVLVSLSMTMLGTTVTQASTALKHCGRKQVEKHDMLALSGGGYRAMLFHVGALWRLNELGCLSTLKLVSSVSGGSIVAGVLAANWSKLEFDANGKATNFEEVVAAPIVKFAGSAIDTVGALKGMLFVSNRAKVLEDEYRGKLVGETRFTDLPSTPEFIFNAANLQTGQLWRISKTEMGDPVTGYAANPKIRVAAAMAASSAYPPVLGPYLLTTKNADWKATDASADGIDDSELEKIRQKIYLIDGGVVDNLGLEPLMDSSGTIFVSDGVANIPIELAPSTGYGALGMRAIGMIHAQQDLLRTRFLIDRFRRLKQKPAGDSGLLSGLDGAYWSIRKEEAHCDIVAKSVQPLERSLLSRIKTRLSSLSDVTRKRLVNLGYLTADRALPYLDRLRRDKTAKYRLISNKVPYDSDIYKISLVDYKPPKRCLQ